MKSKSPLYPKLTYRPDIDGLRAFAVLSVVIFHINEDALSGGFLGVDIFFVLSGFLITQLLIKDIDRDGKLDLITFYKRRIKRIYPALVVVLTVSMVLGYAIMAPDDFSRLAASTIASVLSAANFYFLFAVDTGYFSHESNELPLLHLWSLGIEEQYYIVWPFVAFFLLKWVHGKNLRLGLVICALVTSLALAQVVLAQNVTAAYYLLPTRAWELLAGCFIAFWFSHGGRISGKLAEAMGLVGIILVLLSFFFVSEEDNIPGVGAATAVFGTAMIIASGTEKVTLSSRFLSLKALVGIGLVSYSAYLWHWPLLAFARYAFLEINLFTELLIFGGTFVLAALSYHMVEKPIRASRAGAKIVFSRYLIAPTAIITLVSMAVIYIVSTNQPLIYDWPQYRNTADNTPPYNYEFNCQFTRFQLENFSDPRCVHPSGTKPEALLIGDSNAAHYVGMLREITNSTGLSFRNITQSSCPPLLSGNPLDWPSIGERYRPGCNQYRAHLKRETTRYRTIFVGGSWNVYRNNSNGEFLALFEKTIDELAQISDKVVIFAKPPVFKNFSAKCEIRSVRLGYLDCDRDRFDFIQSPGEKSTNHLIKSLTRKYANVYFFEVSDYICPAGYCSPFLEDFPVYYDSGHLSVAGSTLIGRIIIKDRHPQLHLFQ